MEKGSWLSHSIALRHRTESDSHRRTPAGNMPVSELSSAKATPRGGCTVAFPWGNRLKKAGTRTREGLRTATLRGVCARVCVGGAPRRHEAQALSLGSLTCGAASLDQLLTRCVTSGKAPGLSGLISGR